MFKNKSDNLKLLQGFNLKKSRIPSFLDFKVKSWFKLSKEKIVDEIKSKLDKKICIRSAYALEDKQKQSLAGKFDSYLDIENNTKNLKKFINKIILQYQKYDSKNIYNSNIFVQNFISKPILSGVVTNFNIHDGSPYYVINYDDESSLTNTVTSGGKSGHRVLFIFKKEISKVKSKRFRPIVEAIKEIEKKINFLPVDIEFAVDKNYEVHIFQIRPLSTQKRWKRINPKFFKKELDKQKKNFLINQYKNKKYGNRSIFGLMPDWNPVEMIGNFPSPLSFSLYSKLITDNSWAIARKEMNYKFVNTKLMYSFSGRPYIDARLSFYSLLPKKLKRSLTIKLVNFWVDYLKLNPFLHDKVEFEVVDSCYDFSLEKKIKDQYKFLKKREKKYYLDCLKKHTTSIINNYKIDFKKYFFRLKKLEDYRINLIEKKNSYNKFDFKKNISTTISYLKMNGIIPFSKFARHAFIGKKILNNILKLKLISTNDYDNLLKSLSTITSIYPKLLKDAKKNKVSKKKFEKMFFHLRAGSYDIETKRLFTALKKNKLHNIDMILNFDENVIKILGHEKIQKINKFFVKHKFYVDGLDFIKYALISIKLRENSKFLFTRTLSDLIEIIIIYGKKYNLDKNQLSQLKIDEILKLSSHYKNKKKKKLSSKIKMDKLVQLPFIISSPDDIFVCSIRHVKPNFISNKIVTSEILLLDKKNMRANLKNKIILIENADPGYDWIFGHKIKGLITKHGGVNSHMAIRCQELNIPAVIGAGENNYDLISKSNKILLDCGNSKINILN
tara:strand:- start:4842 stop:7193 length:2352 start_codon:yes stop_codon:yes gene_type:complete